MFFNLRWKKSRPVLPMCGDAVAPRKAVNRIAMSRAITFSGGNAAYIALLAVLYEKTHSAGLVGLGAFASFGVPALASPVAGWIGDHYDRKKVMAISELLGAAVFIFMAALPLPAVLLALRAAASLVAAPFVPATSAALPSLVGCREQLAAANAKLTAASISGGLIGGLLAAAFMAIAAPEAIFIFNAVTFIASAALIMSVNADFSTARTSSEPSRVSVLAAGFRYLGQHHLLRSVTWAYAMIFLGIGFTGPAEVVISNDFAVGAAGFAALMCIFGLGGLAGTRLGGRGLERRALGPLMMLALASGVFVAGYLGIGLAPEFWLVLVGMAIAGGAYGMWRVAHENFVQETTPDAIRGRVFAASEAVEQAAISFGLFGAGALISTYGAASAFRVGAAGSAAAFLLLVGAHRISSARSPRAAGIRRGLPPTPPEPAVVLMAASEPWARTPDQGAG